MSEGEIDMLAVATGFTVTAIVVELEHPAEVPVTV